MASSAQHGACPRVRQWLPTYIVNGVLRADRRVAKRAHIVANAYGFIVRGTLGAERRVPKSASIVDNAYGAIVKSVLREAWRVLKSASMVAYDYGTHRTSLETSCMFSRELPMARFEVLEVPGKFLGSSLWEVRGKFPLEVSEP